MNRDDPVFELEQMFAREDAALQSDAFADVVMKRLERGIAVRRVVLGVGCLVGAMLAVILVPSGLLSASFGWSNFSMPSLSLSSLVGLLADPLWATAACVAVAGMTILAAWGLEKA